MCPFCARRRSGGHSLEWCGVLGTQRSLGSMLSALGARCPSSRARVKEETNIGHDRGKYSVPATCAADGAPNADLRFPVQTLELAGAGARARLSEEFRPFGGTPGAGSVVSLRAPEPYALIPQSTAASPAGGGQLTAIGAVTRGPPDHGPRPPTIRWNANKRKGSGGPTNAGSESAKEVIRTVASGAPRSMSASCCCSASNRPF